MATREAESDASGRQRGAAHVGESVADAIDVDRFSSGESAISADSDDEVIAVHSRHNPALRRTSSVNDGFVVEAVHHASAHETGAASGADHGSSSSMAVGLQAARDTPGRQDVQNEGRSQHSQSTEVDIAHTAAAPVQLPFADTTRSSADIDRLRHGDTTSQPSTRQQETAHAPSSASLEHPNVTWWQGMRQIVPTFDQMRGVLFARNGESVVTGETVAGSSRMGEMLFNRARSYADDSVNGNSDDEYTDSESDDIAGVDIGAAEPAQHLDAPAEHMTSMLAEMASGEFRGHDALGQLYDGDRGFNVARLPLYPSTLELKKRGLKTLLHRHQLQGLLWMVESEHRRHKVGKRTGLWHMTESSSHQRSYRNVASRQKRRDPPLLPRGGINADAMGLGKTLQVIALGIADRNKVPRGIPVRAGPMEEEEDSDASLPSSYCSSFDSDVASSTTQENSSDSDTADSEEEEFHAKKREKMTPSFTGGVGKGKGRANKRQKCQTTSDSSGNAKLEGNLKAEDTAVNNTTLVICPLSVLQNWAKQIDEHCDPKLVKYLTYYGADAKAIRNGTSYTRLFAKNNFIFTTYDTVRTEYVLIEKRRQWQSDSEERRARLRTEYRAQSRKKRSIDPDSDDESFLLEDVDLMPLALSGETPLFSTIWRRIVLDEAHIVRNTSTTIYRAISGLKCERRWAITGTPIVNSTRDLGALAAWIGLEPFDSADMKVWNKLIEKPLKKVQTAQHAAGLMRAVVQSLCLRRHKGMTDADGEPIVKLPQIRYYQHTIALTVSDRDFYLKCEKICREIVTRWMKTDDLHNHRGVVLLFLLRLRQMSCHRQLIGPELLEELQSTDWDAFDAQATDNNLNLILSPEKVKSLGERLKVLVEMGDECPVCMEPLAEREPLITPCAHAFCRECIIAVIMSAQTSQQGPRCPMDRLALPRNATGLVELPKEVSKADDAFAWEDNSQTSAKVRECLRIIQGTLSTDATEKILVFSNFVKFLDIIADELEELGFSFARFHGSMNVQRRDAVLNHFNEPIQNAQIKQIHSAVKRYQERVELERSASENTSGGSSSKLLSALQRVDWKVSDSRGKGTSSSMKKRALKTNETRDVVGSCPSIMLISMGCGALGLNLTVASTVVLMDPWWQSTIEQQAIDRVHRIGQRRDIKVFQMICQDTVEERVLKIQKEKEEVADQAFSGIRTSRGTTNDRRERTLTSARDLARLFGVSERDVQALETRRAA